MIFVIEHHPEVAFDNLSSPERYAWRLQRGKTEPNGEVIAVSAASWSTEKAARQAVAAARKAMGGLRFAKVVVEDQD